MVASQTEKEFVPGQGYTEADWDAVDFPEMTDEELANARPARAVLPPAFLRLWRSIETPVAACQRRRRRLWENPPVKTHGKW